MSDSRHITQMGNILIDSTTGQSQIIPDLPSFVSAHPSSSPDGSLLVTDCRMHTFGGSEKDWGIVVGDARHGGHVILHSFDNTGGAKSWRPSHPHPVFSPDGRRIYFNKSDGRWTRLFVAEALS
jgi:Tol biopolymer transport system component